MQVSDADSKTGAPDNEASDAVNAETAKPTYPQRDADKPAPSGDRAAGVSGSDSVKDSTKDSTEGRQSQVDTAALLAELEQKNRINTQKKRSSGSTFSLFFLIFLLGGAGGWFVYQQWLVQEAYEISLVKLEQENAQIRAQLEQARAAMSEAANAQLARLDENEALLQQAVNDIQDNTEADAQRLEEIRAAVNQDLEGATRQLTEEMSDVASRISALQGQMSNLQHRDLAWMNNEASYLMRLAQRKLAMEADVASAMLLLQTVEELLSRQDSPLANSARISVQQDIQRLASLRLPDRVGIAERLNELSRNLDALSLASSPQTTYNASVQQGLSDIESSAENWWTAALNLIRTVFVWRETDTDGSIALMPDQELLIKQQLLLQLEQARLAVVQADEGMYQVTLDQLQAIMQRYLDQDNPVAVQLLAGLSDLREVEVTTMLPSLTESASLVRQLAADSAGRGE